MIYWGILLIFVLEYVRPGSYAPGLLALKLNSLVPALVAFGSLFSGRDRVPTQELLSDQNTKLIFGFLGLLVLSVLTADVTDYAWTVFTLVLGYVLLFWVIAQQVTTLPRLKGVFKTLIFVHLLVTALNPQLFDGGRQYIASGAFLGDGNDFALSVNIAIPMCLFLIFESTRVRQRIFFIAALAVLVTDVVLTQSRGGTIALACVALYYWLKSDRKLAMGTIGAVAAVMILLLAPSGYFERMNSIGDTEEGSTRGRIDAWKGGIAMAVSNPILGVGAGHFAVMYAARYGGLFIQTAHSIYFLVLGELGLPGLAMLITIIVANLVANRRLAERLRSRDPTATKSDRQLLAAGSAAMIAFATGGAFLSAPYYPHMYVLAGLLAASRRIVAARIEQPVSASVETAPAPQVAVPGLSPHYVPRRAALGSPEQATGVRAR